MNTLAQELLAVNPPRKREFDFSVDSVCCTSRHIRLKPGDKVLWKRMNVRGMHGGWRMIRATIESLGAAGKVRIAVKWRGDGGTLETRKHTVALWKLYRHDWPSATSTSSVEASSDGGERGRALESPEAGAQ